MEPAVADPDDPAVADDVDDGVDAAVRPVGEFCCGFDVDGNGEVAGPIDISTSRVVVDEDGCWQRGMSGGGSGGGRGGGRLGDRFPSLLAIVSV